MDLPDTQDTLDTAAPLAGQVRALVRFYETLTPQSLPQVHALYAREARFKDPFNEVRGTVAIERIFSHMFATLEAPRFVVTAQVLQGRQCFLAWDFHFRLGRGPQASPEVIRGATHLVFDDAGRVALHRDYWDAAEELYEKLPLLGGLMRWLKRRVAA